MGVDESRGALFHLMDARCALHIIPQRVGTHGLSRHLILASLPRGRLPSRFETRAHECAFRASCTGGRLLGSEDWRSADAQRRVVAERPSAAAWPPRLAISSTLLPLADHDDGGGDESDESDGGPCRILSSRCVRRAARCSREKRGRMYRSSLRPRTCDQHSS